MATPQEIGALLHQLGGAVSITPEAQAIFRSTGQFHDAQLQALFEERQKKQKKKEEEIAFAQSIGETIGTAVAGPVGGVIGGGLGREIVGAEESFGQGLLASGGGQLIGDVASSAVSEQFIGPSTSLPSQASAQPQAQQQQTVPTTPTTPTVPAAGLDGGLGALFATGLGSEAPAQALSNLLADPQLVSALTGSIGTGVAEAEIPFGLSATALNNIRDREQRADEIALVSSFRQAGLDIETASLAERKRSNIAQEGVAGTRAGTEAAKFTAGREQRAVKLATSEVELAGKIGEVKAAPGIRAAKLAETEAGTAEKVKRTGAIRTPEQEADIAVRQQAAINNLPMTTKEKLGFEVKIRGLEQGRDRLGLDELKTNVISVVNDILLEKTEFGERPTIARVAIARSIVDSQLRLGKFTAIQAEVAMDHISEVEQNLVTEETTTGGVAKKVLDVFFGQDSKLKVPGVK